MWKNGVVISMPKRPFFLKLDRSEIAKLHDFMSRMAGKRNWRARRRGSAVWWSHQSRRVREIAQTLSCSTRSVYTWLNRFREKGIAGLSDPPRPVKLKPDQVNQLVEVSHWSALGNKKRREEYRMRWSFHKITRWIKDQWGINLSPERVRQIVWQKLREI